MNNITYELKDINTIEVYGCDLNFFDAELLSHFNNLWRRM